MRVGDGHSYLEDDGSVVQAGDMIEVGAPHGSASIGATMPPVYAKGSVAQRALATW
jgi:hypothetical protein